MVGRWYPVAGQAKRSRPLIHLDDPQKQYLSFINFVEAHVLAAIRRRHGVKLPKVRAALNFVKLDSSISSALSSIKTFQTDGLDLFVERYGDLINASREGRTGDRGDHKRLSQADSEGREKGLPIKLLSLHSQHRIGRGA